MRPLPAALAILFLAGAAGCVDPTSVPDREGGLAADPSTLAGSVLVTPTAIRQTIDGFGGSNAWAGTPPDAVVKLLFSTTEGAGLTLLRNRIPFREDVGNTSTTGYDDGFLKKDALGQHYIVDSTSVPGHKTFTLNWSNWDLRNTKALYARAKVYSSEIRGFSTPWTPPNNAYDRWKVDAPNNAVGGTSGTFGEFPSIGGVLDPDHYQDYADVLADYARHFQTNMGYPLTAISIQNEPNWLPRDYESCGWSAEQFHAFLPKLASAWTAKGVTTPVMAPESYDFSEALIAPSLDDPATADVVSIVGVHQYSGTATWLTKTKAAGKSLWVTEVSSGSANDSSINDGIEWAQKIHDDLTVAEVNAFCYWWLWWSDNTKGALIGYDSAKGTVNANKRLFTLGQYSRFVRPGWVRLTASTSPATGVKTTVFRDPESNRFAVVMINASSSATAVTVKGTKAISEATLYRTSNTEDLAFIDDLRVTSGTLAVPLPARSVSTVWGDLK